MEKDNNLVKVETENGESLNLLILKEFEYKKKKYAVLTELDACDKCSCGENCTCDDDCGCKNGGECTCEDCKCEGCNCGEECKCNDDCGCKDGKECTCEDCDCEGCNCEESVFILEITKDENGEEIFKSIDDEKLFDEVVDKADELLNE